MEELACPCGCNNMLMDGIFMKRLVAMREALDFPFVVTSGYRCPEYNSSISSTGMGGPHTTGRAVDIAISGENADKLVGSSYEHGMTGRGINQKGDKRFIHLDDLPSPRPRPRIWSY